MEVRSIYKAARISPKKARDVAREIQGLPVSDAIDALTFTPRKAAFLINKTLKSAVANAENNHELAADNLVVKEANVSDGPTFKRFKPRARGSASGIRKRTSHIAIILTDEIPEEEPKRDRSGSGKKAKPSPAPKKAKEEKPAKPAAEAKAPAAPSGGTVDEKRGLIFTEAPAEVDDLKEISGVGPALEGKLNENGIYTYAQIAGWNADNIAEFDDLLSFKGRIDRDDWLTQAKTLHEEKYGNA